MENLPYLCKWIGFIANNRGDGLLHLRSEEDVRRSLAEPDSIKTRRQRLCVFVSKRRVITVRNILKNNLKTIRLARILDSLLEIRRPLRIGQNSSILNANRSNLR